MSPFLRAVLFAICLFCFSPLSVLAEYVFDGTFTLERKYGDPIVVKKVNFEGRSAVHYTTVDGKQGYTREFIITNLAELYRVTNRTANSSREEYVERNPAINTKLYTEKIYRLDREVKDERLGVTHVTKNISKKPKPTLSAQEAGELSLSQIQEQIEEQIEEIKNIYSLPVAEIIQ